MPSEIQNRSLSEVHESIKIEPGLSGRRKLLAFLGPAYMVSVGYMDPGNWATDIAGGSRYGYALIWVLLMSNLMALLLQSLSARLGIVRGRDLAQASRELYPRPVNFFLYLLAEIAIAACDLAEVLGMAIGLNLLFDIPLLWGVLICALDTFLLLFLLQWGIRKMEAFIISLVGLIGMAFVAEMFLAQPSLGEISRGFLPSLPDSGALYIAIGIIGATVMPHNLYLHSALVQTRKFDRKPSEIRRAIRFNILDSTIALNLAFFVNAAILILAASTFFKNGLFEIADIRDAHELLAPLLGSSLAPVLFAVALIFAGQSSTITGTLAGQIVMEGYLNIRIAPWLRRLITRLIAIIPAILVIQIQGEEATGDLLILSQVILSLQLGFAVIPLIHFVSDGATMGEFKIPAYVQILAWLCASVIVGLNIKLVYEQLQSWISSNPDNTLLPYILVPIALFTLLILLYITIAPFRAKKRRELSAPHPRFREFGLTEARKFHKIAVALDFSSSDEEALQLAIQQGGKEAAYFLFHVNESAGALLSGKLSSDYESQSDREFLARYETYLQSEGYTVQTELGFGIPSKILPNLVKKAGCDLLIMGAHGHKGLKDAVLGTTINAVRHALDIPVLTMKRK